MALGSKLKNFFLPDAETSRQRRLKTFGTENKAIVGGLIVGAAVAAIAAPVAIAARGGIGAVTRGVGNAIAGSSFKTKVATAVGLPIAAGLVVNDPTRITKAPAAVLNFQGNLYEVAKSPSIQNFKDLIVENPILAVGSTALLTGAAAAGTAGIIDAVRGRDVDVDIPEIKVSDIPFSPTQNFPPFEASPSSATKGGSPIPVTPETQVIGRAASSGVAKRKKAKKRPVSSTPSVRVQLLNQNNYIQGAT